LSQQLKKPDRMAIVSEFKAQYNELTSNVVLSETHCPHGSADNCFISSQPDTGLHCKTTNTGHHATCLFAFQLLLVFTAITHEGMVPNASPDMVQLPMTLRQPCTNWAWHRVTLLTSTVLPPYNAMKPDNYKHMI